MQNAAQFGFSTPLGKSFNIIENIEGLSLVDTSFAPGDSPLPLVMGVTIIPNIVLGTVLVGERLYERARGTMMIADRQTDRCVSERLPFIP